MAHLLPLAFSVARGCWDAEDDVRAEAAGGCRFCGDPMPVAPGFIEGEAGPAVACLHCRALHRLGRDTVGQEAVLIWAPEISQAALNWLVRGIHRVFLAHAEPPVLDARPQTDTPRLRVAYRVYEGWAALAPFAQARVGTSSPREFGAALLSMPPERRAVPDGLRLLHCGRHFIDGEDAYPALLASATMREAA